MSIRKAQSEYISAIIAVVVITLIVSVSMEWLSYIRSTSLKVVEEVEHAKENLAIVFDTTNSTLYVVSRWDELSVIEGVVIVLDNGSIIIQRISNPLKLAPRDVAKINVSVNPNDVRTICVYTKYLHLFCGQKEEPQFTQIPLFEEITVGSGGVVREVPATIYFFIERTTMAHRAYYSIVSEPRINMSVFPLVPVAVVFTDNEGSDPYIANSGVVSLALGMNLTYDGDNLTISALRMYLNDVELCPSQLTITVEKANGRILNVTIPSSACLSNVSFVIDTSTSIVIRSIVFRGLEIPMNLKICSGSSTSIKIVANLLYAYASSTMCTVGEAVLEYAIISSTPYVVIGGKSLRIIDGHIVDRDVVKLVNLTTMNSQSDCRGKKIPLVLTMNVLYKGLWIPTESIYTFAMEIGKGVYGYVAKLPFLGFYIDYYVEGDDFRLHVYVSPLTLSFNNFSLGDAGYSYVVHRIPIEYATIVSGTIDKDGNTYVCVPPTGVKPVLIGYTLKRIGTGDTVSVAPLRYVFVMPCMNYDYDWMIYETTAGNSRWRIIYPFASYYFAKGGIVKSYGLGIQVHEVEFIDMYRGKILYHAVLQPKSTGYFALPNIQSIEFAQLCRDDFVVIVDNKSLWFENDDFTFESFICNGKADVSLNIVSSINGSVTIESQPLPPWISWEISWYPVAMGKDLVIGRGYPEDVTTRLQREVESYMSEIKTRVVLRLVKKVYASDVGSWSPITTITLTPSITKVWGIVPVLRAYTYIKYNTSRYPIVYACWYDKELKKNVYCEAKFYFTTIPPSRSLSGMEMCPLVITLVLVLRRLKTRKYKV